MKIFITEYLTGPDCKSYNSSDYNNWYKIIIMILEKKQRGLKWTT